MKKILFIALVCFGIWQYQHKNNNKLPTTVDSTGKPVVVVYTFAGCGSPCANVISILNQRSVPFEEIVLSQNDKNSAAFKKWESYRENSMPLTLAGESKAVGDSQSEIVRVLATNYQTQYLTNLEKRYFKDHFDSAGNPKVVLYGTDWCPGCASLRKELRADNQPFEDIDVEKVTDSNMLLQGLQIGGYPTVYWGYQRVNGTTLSDIKKLM